MMPEAAREDPGLDPVIRSLLESRARQSGLSVSDYLAHIVLAPHHGATVAILPSQIGLAIAPGIRTWEHDWVGSGPLTQGSGDWLLKLHGKAPTG